MFDFRDIIKKYGKTIYVIEETEGYYDYDNGGEWVPGQREEVGVTAAILQISTKELNSQTAQYGEGGLYTTDDRKIYIHKALEVGQQVIDREDTANKAYTIDREVDYSYHANGLRVYYARRVAK